MAGGGVVANHSDAETGVATVSKVATSSGRRNRVANSMIRNPPKTCAYTWRQDRDLPGLAIKNEACGG